MRSRISKLLALAGVTVAGGHAQAAVVVDPVPAKILPGLTVGIESFLTIPPSSGGLPSTRIQYVTPAGDGSGRIFVNDQRGTLYASTTTGTAPTTYLDLADAGVGFINPGPEGGFLGVAFHPNFNGDPNRAGYNLFYTHHSATVDSGVADYLDDPANDHESVIREWSVLDPTASNASILGTREILRVGQFANNHNGGTIGFNPTATEGSADYGNLYIGLGDGGGANDPRDYGQNLAVPLGKILRINPLDTDGDGGLAYTIPTDNPFLGSGGLGEIWAYGLRNPQQFSWDPVTGQMYITDIGQAQLEEVNLGVAGANYGWVLREGTFAKSPDKGDFRVFDTPPNDGSFADPIGQYDHDEGSAIGGGFIYRGSAIPELQGMYLMTDIVNGRIFYFDPTTASPGQPGLLQELLLTLNGEAFTFLGSEGYNGRVDLRFGIDDNQELYMLTKRDGDIFRFASAVLAPVPEPGSWAMMVAGFGLCGAALRRRAAPAALRA